MAGDAFLELTLRVGVTGQRHGLDAEAVRLSVARILEVLPGKLAPSGRTKVNLVVVSPLADGADRIAALAGLEAGARLWVPFPAKWDDYALTFGEGQPEDVRARARDEAEWLRHQAAWAGRVSYRSGDDAYVDLGRAVVDHCDVLIAIIDPSHPAKPGGSAQTLAYARGRHVPVVRVDPRGHTTWEFRQVRKAREVERFNTLRPSPGYAERVAAEVRRIVPARATDDGFTQAVRAQAEWFVPFIARADDLAIAYRAKFHAAGDAVALFALSAVAIGTAQSLFGWSGKWTLLEAALLIAGVLLVVAATRYGLPARWLCHRALAERLRGALFLAVAGVTEEPEHGPHRDDEGEPWVIEAADAIWAARPQPAALPSATLDRRELLLERWVLHQRDYHESAQKRATWHWHFTRRAAFIAAILTAVCATLHGAGAIWHVEVLETRPGSSWLTALAILIPAAAGALAAVGELREWRHNAERFERMASVLDDVAGRFAEVGQDGDVNDLARLADAVIRDENRDWFGLMLGRELEPMA